MTGPHRPHTSEDILAKADWIKRLSLSLVRDREKAEDLAQETLLRALQYRSDPKRSLSAWIRRVARNLVIAQKTEEIRRRKRDRLVARSEADLETQEKQSSPEINVKEVVLAEVQKLREPFRTAVILHFFDGLSPQEMAVRLGISQDNAYKRIQRGLALLRKQLDKRYRGREFWMVAFLESFKSAPKWKIAAAVVAVPTALFLLPTAHSVPPLEVARLEKPIPVEVPQPIEIKPVAQKPLSMNWTFEVLENSTPPEAAPKAPSLPKTAAAPKEAPPSKAPSIPPKKARSLGPNQEGIIKGTLVDTDGEPVTHAELILMKESFARHMMEKGLLFLGSFGPDSSLGGNSFFDLGVAGKDYAILETDSNGDFECSGPGMAASVLLFGNSRLTSVGGARTTLTLPDGSTQGHEYFVVAPSRKIEVKVLDPEGTPAIGARVTVSYGVSNLGKIKAEINLTREYPSLTPLSGTTNHRGEITFERIPDLLGATITVQSGKKIKKVTLAELEKNGFEILLPPSLK